MKLATLFLLSCLFFCDSIQALSFVEVEKQDFALLESRVHDSRGATSAEALLYHFFYLDRLESLGKIHALKRERIDFLRRCEESSVEKNNDRELGLLGYACAVVRLQLLSTQLPWEVAEQGEKLTKELSWISKTNVEQTDRFYGEGRLYYLLPPSAGQSYGKSLLAFQMLDRLHPNTGTYLYWLARIYQHQGNYESARDYYQRAEAAGAKEMIQRYFSEGSFQNFSVVNDGESFGWGPALFFTPGSGAGLSLSIYDDGISDEPHRFQAVVGAGTRGLFSLRTNYLGYFNSLKPIGLMGHALVRHGKEDFYPGGGSTVSEDRVTLSVQRWNVSTGVRIPFLSTLHFDFLARTMGRGNEGGPTFVANGFEGTVRWDTRDSLVLPTEGGELEAGAFFSMRGLGSTDNFVEGKLTGSWYQTWNMKHTLGLSSEWHWLSGEGASEAFFPRLGLDTSLAFVREGQLQAKALATLFSEYRLKVTRPMSLMAYAQAAWGSDDLGSIFRSPVRWGGGGGVVWQVGAQKSKSIKITLGSFAGEFIVNVLAGAL